MKITKATIKDRKEILVITKKLKKWFDNHAINYAIPTDLKFHHTLIAKIDKKVVGFASYSSGEGEVYISWLGVDPKFQGKGIGTKLIKHLENELKKLKIKEFKLETLSANIKYAPYKRTRAFYEKLGFKQGKTRPYINRFTKEKLELVTFRKNIE